MARYVGHLVGWVEVKRVLSLRALPKPITLAPERSMGFGKTREERVLPLPILHSYRTPAPARLEHLSERTTETQMTMSNLVRLYKN